MPGHSPQAPRRLSASAAPAPAGEQAPVAQLLFHRVHGAALEERREAHFDLKRH